MRLRPATPRPIRPREAVVPMINVVFLLLIFFLMTAVIAPPEPFAVDVPQSEGDDPAGTPAALYVGADGALAWGALRGKAVFAALAEHDGILEVRADAASARGQPWRGLLPQLAASGIDEIVIGHPCHEERLPRRLFWGSVALALHLAVLWIVAPLARQAGAAAPAPAAPRP
jgi:biopolymer transport protein ExbD